MPEPTLQSRLAGGVWGHLVGDAIGVPYEFKKASEIRSVRFGAVGTHRQPPGTWSDDGALMLATLDSLLSFGFDPQDQGRRYLDWFDRAAYTPNGDGKFDFGHTTDVAIGQLLNGVDAVDAGGRDESDNGNGSLMRILPIALMGRDLPRDDLVQQAEASSRITHAHAWSQVACALYVVLAQQLLDGAQPASLMDDTVRLLRQDFEITWPRPESAAAFRRVLAHQEREGRGFVIDSLWSAWDAFVGATSYEDTITRAIHYGNDTDTTACIAGGLAGIHWGIEGIPRLWLDGMRGHDIADPLVARLVATAPA
ncbi:MAG TPA: ADP-ribosylglycohydrolase family protein [Candidatus Saccharimonadales bacterium]|nr:ADP-ribosylglycohydrolase family protein [Candidatus Saccharimonadales bacterium]